MAGQLQRIIWKSMKCYVVLSENSPEKFSLLKLMPKLHILKPCNLGKPPQGGFHMLCLAYKTGIWKKWKAAKYTKWKRRTSLLKSSLILLVGFCPIFPSEVQCRAHSPSLDWETQGCEMIGSWGRACCLCLVHIQKRKGAHWKLVGQRKRACEKAHGDLILRAGCVCKKMTSVGGTMEQGLSTQWRTSSLSSQVLRLSQWWWHAFHW